MKSILLSILFTCAAWAQTPAPKAPAKATPTAKATPAKTTPAKAAPAKAATAKAPAKAAAKTTAKQTAKAATTGSLLNPASLKLKAPAIFVVRLETTKGNIDIRVKRSWAPQGVERFYNLVKAGFYDNNYFFRTLDFIAQFGMSSRPEVSRVWADRTIFDDRPLNSNLRGTVSFAASGQPNSRSTQVFINKLDQNSYLDSLKFAPFGEVVEGMDVVDKLYSGYGDIPVQQQISDQGEAFLNRYYPRLDKIIKATVIAVPEP